MSGSHRQHQVVCLATMEPGDLAKRRAPSVFVFNPFAEGYIARGDAFTPVRHQAMLARDLANLPQFLCEPGDILLVAKTPSADFLSTLEQAGFPLPEIAELKQGRIDPDAKPFAGKVVRLRPWAWGPDSVKLFEPLFDRVTEEAPVPTRYFNDNIAQLYSKAWSADFLRKVLTSCREEAMPPRLCSAQETGVAVATLKDALEAVAAIRGRGHHRVVVKAGHGLAGHNAIRLWEPELLPAQRQWLARAFSSGGQLVVEPWLDRELDFSVQFEMGPRSLKLCGYTGLINDRKGQFFANWAESDYRQYLPAKIAKVLGASADIAQSLEQLYVKISSLLEAELRSVGFEGPVSIDAFVFRTPQGDCRLKPVVEINPRYTMGRLTVELMKHACPGCSGVFRLVSRAQARAAGFADFSGYSRSLVHPFPLRLAGKRAPKIAEGALCLNDPKEAQVCLAVFEVSRRIHQAR